MSEMFKSTEGSTSSKRVWGSIYLALGALMAILDQITKYNIDNFEIFLVIVVTGGSLLGLGLAERFAKMNINK